MRDIENPMIVDWVWRRFERDTQTFDDVEIEYFDDEVVCAVCGTRLMREEALESERYEDMFLCGDSNCSNIHYKGWSCNMSAQQYYLKK